jgi:hypothetical protein
MVSSETAWLTLVAESGKSERELLAGLQQVHEHLLKSPAAKGHNDPARHREEGFTFGLDLVLDGLDARLHRRS